MVENNVKDYEQYGESRYDVSSFYLAFSKATNADFLREHPEATDFLYDFFKAGSKIYSFIVEYCYFYSNNKDEYVDIRPYFKANT